MFDSQRPQGLQPTRLLRPWDFPGKSTGVGCHCLLQGFLAAAAAKSLQSCPTLCDPIDGSPPASPVPGILQARTLEWVAIAFSKANTNTTLLFHSPTIAKFIKHSDPQMKEE